MTYKVKKNIVIYILIISSCSQSQIRPSLEKAIYAHDYNLIKNLLISGENPNEKDNAGTTPLMCAIFNDDSTALGILVKYGADIHSLVGPFNQSLLHLCVDVHKYKAAKYLMRNGLNVEIIDSSGLTPLISAINIESVPMVSFLLDNHANPNAICRLGSRSFNITPLSSAVGATLLQDSSGALQRSQNIQIIQLLLKAGASAEPPIRLDNGNSYLHIAVENCNDNAIKILLQYGANKNVKNDDGARPYDIAVRHDCRVSEILLK